MLVHHRCLPGLTLLLTLRPSVGRLKAFVVQFGGREEAGATLKCPPMKLPPPREEK